MNEFSLPYGKGYLSFQIPDQYKVDLIAPKDAPAASDAIQAVKLAIESPLGIGQLPLYKNAKTVAIAINDKTRPVPHQYLLPPLLESLASSGIASENITLLIATGTHLPMPNGEFGMVVPEELLSRYPVFSHDCDATDLIDLGITARNTPILMNRRFMQADLRIVVGNIEPHHFMGFSGGVKSAAVGLAGRETIVKNHSMLTHPLAKTGHYRDNPMRQDVEEIGARASVHFALNAILNNDKNIAKVLFGEPVAVMNAGIPLVQELCQVDIENPYDFVIASAGGYPKDINLYQAQKALTHAAMLTKDGGTILLLAACSEGVGSSGYEQFMYGVNTFDEVFTKFKQLGFQVGPHKAYQIARDASRVNIIMLSKMDPNKVKQLLLTPAIDIAQTIATILARLSSENRIAIMPLAPITIPSLG